MERDAIDEAGAYNLLHENSRVNNRNSSTSRPRSSTATASSPGSRKPLRGGGPAASAVHGGARSGAYARSQRHSSK